MRIFSFLCTLMLATQTFSTFAQSDLASMFDSLSLKAQFDYVYEKSETYEQYKVVKISTFNLLKSSSNDSVKFYRDNLAESNKEIANLKNTVEQKEVKITTLTADLDAVTNSKNSMFFLGAELSKGAYNTMMWGIVFGLMVLGIVLFLMFKRSNSVTNETKHRLKEVEEEYESHRKSALKREQKLARELMDERLKHKF